MRNIAMNKGLISISALAVVFLTTGCSSHPDPIIDMKGVDPVSYTHLRAHET